VQVRVIAQVDVRELIERDVRLAADAVAAIEDPRAVERIAVRFSAPLFPGETVTTRVWNVDCAFAFESINPQGTAVLKDGRLELR